MRVADLFGLGVRLFGLYISLWGIYSLFFVVLQVTCLVTQSKYSPLNHIVLGLSFLAFGVVMLRHAERLVAFSYPRP